MQENHSPVPRSPLLTAGILMTVVLSVVTMTFAVIVGGLGLGAGGVAMLSGAEEALPIGLVLGAGVLVLGGLFLYHALLLFACSRAWSGSRNWTIALIVFSAFGLMNLGLLSTPTNLLTIVGAAMALGQTRGSFVSA